MKNLHQLRIFLKVAEVGSLGKASAQLHIAQPALSRQIQILEAEAGTALFTRQWRGMQLTPAGKELQRTVGPAVQELDKALADIRSLSDTPSGYVKFGVVSTLSGALVGRVANRVAKEFPGIMLATTDGFSQRLIEWLHRGDLDFAIVCGSEVDLHMSVDELIVDELVLVGPQDSFLDPNIPVALKDAIALPLVLPSSPNSMRLIVENAASKIVPKLDVRFEANSQHLLFEFASSGVGYAVSPLSTVLHHIQVKKYKLKYAPIIRPKLAKQLVLARNSEVQMSPSAKHVHRMIREEIANAAKSGDLAGAHLLFDTKKTA